VNERDVLSALTIVIVAKCHGLAMVAKKHFVVALKSNTVIVAVRKILVLLNHASNAKRCIVTNALDISKLQERWILGGLVNSLCVAIVRQRRI